MQLPLLAVSLTFLTTTLSLSLNDILPRQAPGTPQYDCHLACGTVIQLGRTADYCSTSNFTTSLTSCLSCALTFDIWTIYSDSVISAAESCDLPAEPLPANSTASSSLSSEISASASSASSASLNTAQVTVSETAATGDPQATESVASASGGEVTVSETDVTASVTATGAAAEQTEAGDDAGKLPVVNGLMAGLGLVAWLVV